MILNTGVGCALALVSTFTLVEGRGAVDYSRMTPILTLDAVAERVAGDELAIETANGHTKVTSTDLSAESAGANFTPDDEIFVDQSPREVADHLCQPKTRRHIDLGNGEVFLCTANPLIR